MQLLESKHFIYYISQQLTDHLTLWLGFNLGKDTERLIQNDPFSTNMGMTYPEHSGESLRNAEPIHSLAMIKTLGLWMYRNAHLLMHVQGLFLISASAEECADQYAVY